MRKPVINILLTLILPIVTWAHEIRPGYLEIKENEDHSLQITWKQPMMGEYGIPLHLQYPQDGWLIHWLLFLTPNLI